MLFVHRFGMVRINETTNVVGAYGLAVAHGLDRLDCRRRRGAKDKLRVRCARSDEHKRNECNVFHG